MFNNKDLNIHNKIKTLFSDKPFIGLSLSEAVPDHSTIWRFRNLLHTENLLDSLLVQINHHLAKNSLIVAQGSVNIIDATVIEAKQCRSKKNKQGDNTQDPEAAWNVKTASDGRRKSTYGFKLHANTDEDGYQENDLYAWQCA